MKTFAIVACLLGACDNECDSAMLQCPDCGPGEIRFGAAYYHGSPDYIAASGEGVVIGACGSPQYFDGRMHARSFVGPVGGAGTFYRLERSDATIDDWPAHDLVALDSDGDEIWRREAIAKLVETEITASADGVYVLTPKTVRALSRDGDPRFEIERPDVFFAFDGGMLLGFHEGETTTATRVEQRTANNDIVWQRAVASVVDDFDRRSDGTVVYGSKISAGELGPDGLPRWEHRFVASAPPATVHALPDGKVVVAIDAGQVTEPSVERTDYTDAAVLLVSEHGGVERATPIRGDGVQTIHEVAVASDGSVWLFVHTWADLDSDVSLEVGKRTYRHPDDRGNGASYVINIVP